MRNWRGKRLRKLSFNKVREHIEVFNSGSVSDFNELQSLNDGNGSSRNPFEELKVDASYDNLLLSMEDTELEDKVLIKEIDEASSQDGGEPPHALRQEDTLTLNRDYIAFSDSSAGEEEDHNSTDDEVSSESSKSPMENAQPEFNPNFPWLLNQDHSQEKQISQWLTQEIKDFVAYISPTGSEIISRNRAVQKIRKAVRSLWRDSDLHVFGSYATDLYMPGSDIDCVVNSTSMDKENTQYLYELARHLRDENLAVQIEVISRTRVPIIKFIEPHSNLHIDVSFERLNGIEAARLIRGWLRETPGLRELVLIIKQFLAARRLNDVHTGGLGGFSIICLVYSFMNLHPKIRTQEIDPLDNLGVLLIDFFELYGKNFAYDDVALSFNDDHFPVYVPKSHWKSLLPVRNSFALAIQDPMEHSNNISRSSFNMRVIKKAFAGAFDLLTNKCYELNMATFKDRVGESILANVIKYKGERRDFQDDRAFVENRAILENEKFHRKRARTLYRSGKPAEDVFLDPSDDDLITGGHDDTEMYRLDEPAKKKLKKKKKATPTQRTKTVTPVKKSKQKSSSKHPRQSIDSLMGLSDHDGDTERSSVEPTRSETGNAANLKRATVDAQTRRDYWFSKGQALAKGSW
ncbi:non-canonical poly(A) polymerase TRF5 KNAG_0K02380 [Huiozyma naganishii CBS 8797]|uniref:polynucleotide adenylyltransferase n=1 Tax=Huiozyma naganishii (strain ATCC MYA-139 / BCRC 22969 / CBS 8797 / KCTC 17520 / NBRC 10181 / NCYC 3082 / Yp74L-3) TaxID=1071383 RepID=J7SAZ6_HUIN7|nr:hypothetical protein KNAG_0K02380 [Kazachstania naganishii CBS 8797]CCK72601.1 hypothetical protein KNAG_0K02380 [Kazachstania naganishii CBS 8797]